MYQHFDNVAQHNACFVALIIIITFSGKTNEIQLSNDRLFWTGVSTHFQILGNEDIMLRLKLNY